MGHFLMIWKKSYLKWLEPHALSEYYPNTSFYWVVDLTLAEKAPFLVKNRDFSIFIKIHIFGCFLGLLSWNLRSNTHFMIHLINALTVKNMMKNVFWGNHIFVKLREREGQGVDPGRSLKGHLWMVDGGWWISFPWCFTLNLVASPSTTTTASL